MTNIEFYILDSLAPAARLQMVCQLAQHHLKHGKSVHIHAPTAAEKIRIAEQTHSIVVHTQAKLSVDFAGAPADDPQVLINLAPEVPHFFSSCEKTIEIVHEDDKTKALGRERYRYYQHRGYPLKHYRIAEQLV